MRFIYILFFVFLISGSIAQMERLPEWAVKIQVRGLPNFHKINDNLYRGAQTDETGMVKLDSMGIRTIVNLRSFHSDRDEMEELSFNYEHIYMKAWHPKEKEIVRFLQIVSDMTNYPVFLHCMHGADRTGLMAAIYRVAVQEWSKNQALEEMKNRGFGYHTIWKNIESWFLELEIEAVKNQAGILKNISDEI